MDKVAKKLLTSFFDSQLSAAFTATGADYFLARGSGLAHEESVGGRALTLTWLVGSFTHIGIFTAQLYMNVGK